MVDSTGAEKPAHSLEDATLDNFRALFTEHYSYVFRSLRRLGVEEANLPDLTHEVFLAVHARLSTFDRERPLRPWLFGIAFRVASNYRRLPSRRHEHAIIDEFEVMDDAPMLDDQISTRQAQELVQRAMDALEPEKRAVFVMHEIDEQPVPEIARTLEIELNTAYSRLRLARVLFARALAREISRRR